MNKILVILVLFVLAIASLPKSAIAASVLDNTKEADGIRVDCPFTGRQIETDNISSNFYYNIFWAPYAGKMGKCLVVLYKEVIDFDRGGWVKEELCGGVIGFEGVLEYSGPGFCHTYRRHGGLP